MVSSGGAYGNSQTCAFSIRSDLSPFAAENPLSASFYITVKFSAFDLECMWDYVRVYEDGITGTVIGAYTGDSVPPMISSAASELFLFFRSDAIGTATGFEATYMVALCPNDCNSIGICSSGTCVCPSTHTGLGCEIETCPNGCTNASQGTCDNINNNGCVCASGFKGAQGSHQLRRPCASLTRLADAWRGVGGGARGAAYGGGARGAENVQAPTARFRQQRRCG